ncbi:MULTISPECIES: 5-oxoprolinase subunit C family protein [Nocardia]|uniref:5-oxoprolinase subunit C family protein n=1 Tax=Nocardia TaxID=1817 RepID=UPI000D69734B|nr:MULTISPECIES: biotin-dependent carboxyltransferase family protein [Nocardia]
MIVVEQVGPLATIQDLGRPGWFGSGVGPSGAADRASSALANRLVGNPESAALLEVLVGGVVLRADRHHTLAVTGAPAPATVDGTPVGPASVVELEAGQTLRLGMAQRGLRSYIAVRGGIDIAPVLGSRSLDTMSGIGPPPVRAGDLLPVGPAPRTYPIVDLAPVVQPEAGTLTVHAMLGPRDDWFIEPNALFEGEWSVSPDADRVGVRLERRAGPPLRRRSDDELRTEGVALGSIQVPPSGNPVIFLADHPITGGYPVIAVVLDAEVDLVAQARPGQALRLRPPPR